MTTTHQAHQEQQQQHYITINEMIEQKSITEGTATNQEQQIGNEIASQ